MADEKLPARLRTALEFKKMIYRSLPSGAPGLVGAGSYPKISDRRYYHTAYYKEEEYSGVYLLRGRGVYRDESGFETVLEPGDFFHRLPGVRHWSEPEVHSDWLEVFLVLPAELWRGWADMLPGGRDEKSFRPWRAGLVPGLAEEFLALRDGLENTQGGDLTRLILRMQELLLEFWRLSRGDGKRPAGLIERACLRLRQDLAREMELEAVAQELGLGYESFRRWFRDETGISPGAYRNRARLERACELLRGSDEPLAYIAQQLGYRDAFAFSRQFKIAFRCAPSEFRRSESEI